MSDKLVKYTRKERLGIVGVDSGKLMVINNPTRKLLFFR
jgi:hypothetical protein